MKGRRYGHPYTSGGDAAVRLCRPSFVRNDGKLSPILIFEQTFGLNERLFFVIIYKNKYLE